MHVSADARFTRRIGAVLVVQPAAGGDIPAAVVATAVERLRASGAEAEPLGPDGIVAVFDDLRATVDAATQLHRSTPAGSSSDAPAAWRCGVDASDVVVSGDGSVLRGAIDRGTALARIASPGTTAVTAAVAAALGHVDGAELVATSVDDPAFGGRAYLVVPIWARPALPRRRLVALLAGSAALAGSGAGVWFVARQRAQSRHVVLGVGPFRASGTVGGKAWIGPALRDGLNTQLSELSGVQVFSDDFMDFVMSHESLSLIEAATKLGMEKMVSGSVVVVGDTVRIEARIVDVRSGLFEGAHVVSGREDEFLTMESDLVQGVIGELGLQLTAEEQKRLASRRATDVDTLRRLLGVEGELAPGREEHGDPPQPRERDGHFRLLDLLGPDAAFADDATDVQAFLERFRRATEARDIAAVAGMYATFPAAQREALERYFAGVRDLHVQIERIESAVSGDEAVVSYTRTDDFVDVSSGRRLHGSVRVTKRLRRVDGAWRFAP